MPYQSLKLTGGVTVNETPALNEAGISSSQMIRLKPDPKGLTLPEKLGGWAKFLSTQVTSVIRALLAWEDTNANKWIAFGTSSATAAQLSAYQCTTNASGITTAQASSTYTLTPEYLTGTVPAYFQTTAGSSTVTVTDNVVTGLSAYDSVFISTPVSVGGLVLFGQYQITSANLNQYTITALNTLGYLAYAAYSTVASPLTVTGGTYSAGSPSTITYTYAVQASAPFVVGENVNVTGVVASGSSTAWNGSCIVTACTTSQVTVLAPSGASGTWSSGGSLSNYGVTPIFSLNNGSSQVTVILPDHGQTVGSNYTILNQSVAGSFTLLGNYVVTSVPNSYSFTINGASTASATVSNYQNAAAISSGSSTTAAVTLNFAAPVYMTPTLTITSGSSTISAVTLNFSSSAPYQFTVGKSIYVSGITNPSAWNGTYVVTGSTSTSVTYSLAGSALSWVAGGTVQSPLFNLNSQIQVTGASPAAWNGIYTVTGSTPTSVTYALSGSALSWSGGGAVSDIGGDVAIVYSITPGPLPSTTGWGLGQWGAGGWGTGVTPSQTTGSAIAATTWSLDNWGEILLAAPVGFTPLTYAGGSTLIYGPIYAWDPVLQQPQASPITAGPSAMLGFFVAMPQRQIISWGSTFTGDIDPLLVRWCDVSNYGVWIASNINQAGSYRLATGSTIVGGMQAQQQGLLWTDVGLWSMQYIGPPYVYSFNQVGRGCGLIARNAAGQMNGIVYWMGARQFFRYTGAGVEPIMCPIWDVAFQDLDLANVSKITCAVNSLFEEISWFFPVQGGNGENSAYIRYNGLLDAWDYGTLGRTAWLDTSVLGPPIGYDPVNQYLYQHEISADADGAAMTPSFTTGYFAIAEGQEKAFLDEVWPDFKWGYYGQTQNASVQITFNACDFPGQTPTTYGPYVVTQGTKWFNPRIRTRLLSITVSSSDAGTFWRMGDIRYRVAADGRY